MSKLTKQDEKIKYSIIVSIILHMILIIFLVHSSFIENIDAISNGSNINAVMVDLGVVLEQYNRQQNKIKYSKQTLQNKTTELQKNQITEQLWSKQFDFEQELLQKTQEKSEQHTSEQKATADAQKKATADAQKKATADAQKKATADAQKKATADAVNTKFDYVDDLLNELTSEKNVSQLDKAISDTAASEQIKQKKSTILSVKVNSYLSQVKRAIQSKFYDANTFAGKTCDIRIRLAPNGFLISATPMGGDQVLCLAAINAARTAKIPKPPSRDIWQVVKEATVEFKP